MLLSQIKDNFETAKIAIKGDSIKFENSNLAKNRKKGQLNSHYKFNGNKNSYGKNKDYRKLNKKISRTNNNLIKLYSSLIIKPNFFISLSFVWDNLEKEKNFNKNKMDYKQMRECVLSLIKELKKIYPESWFIIVTGYGYEVGIHFHILSRINTRQSTTNLDYEIRKLWQNIIGSDEKEISKTQSADEGCLVYLINEKKRYEYIKLDEKLDGQKRYTTKYIPATNKYNKFEFELTLLEKECLFENLINFFKDDNKAASSAIAQIVKVSGMISFIPHDYIMYCMLRVLEKRKGRSLKEMQEIQAKYFTKRITERQKRYRSKRYGQNWSEI